MIGLKLCIFKQFPIIDQLVFIFSWTSDIEYFVFCWSHRLCCLGCYGTLSLLRFDLSWVWNEYTTLLWTILYTVLSQQHTVLASRQSPTEILWLKFTIHNEICGWIYVSWWRMDWTLSEHTSTVSKNGKTIRCIQGFMPFVCRECKEVRFCTKLASTQGHSPRSHGNSEVKLPKAGLS
jgi:hypothetical protein